MRYDDEVAERVRRAFEAAIRDGKGRAETEPASHGMPPAFMSAGHIVIMKQTIINHYAPAPEGWHEACA